MATGSAFKFSLVLLCKYEGMYPYRTEHTHGMRNNNIC